ncbi:MAG: heparinase II/III family protein [Elusimicrobiales bacterium]|nr:heparinase II/III family protein [Elusimicrobiales bacterium]
MNIIAKYFNTLKYLKPKQWTSRLLFKCFRPIPDLSQAPQINYSFCNRKPFPVYYTSYLNNNTFFFLNEKRKGGPGLWNDPSAGKLWLYNLHYFDYLRQQIISAKEADTLIASWIKENPPASGNGWEPYTLSLRIVNWIKYHISVQKLSDEAIHSLAVQTRYLSRRIEYHLMGNHLLANAKALVFAGLFFSGPEAEKWLNKGIEIYGEQLPEQILKDGFHFELSPMYHSIILEDLLDVFNICSAINLRSYINRMLACLHAVTAPDGSLFLFNDAANGISLSPASLVKYANSLNIKTECSCESVSGCADLPFSGYARLSSGSWTAFCDGGGIGPDYQPGHAHADTLSFELWHKQHLIIADSGTALYAAGRIRAEQRSTAGHNTVVLDGDSSSQVWSAHRVAKRAKITSRSFGGDVFSAAHNGYGKIIHLRHWHISPQGLEITDKISENAIKSDVLKNKRKKNHKICSYLHFAPGIKCRITGCGYAELLCGNKKFCIKFPSGMKTDIIEGCHSREFGIVEKTDVLRLSSVSTIPFKIKITIQAI